VTGRTRILAALVAAAVVGDLAGAGAYLAGHDGAGRPSRLGRTADSAALRARAADAQRVLDAQAAAVRARERGAFTATIAVAAAAFRDRQEREFTNLTRLPLADWRYRVTRVEASGPSTVTVAATLTYRLRGFDAAAVTRARHVTLTRQGARWAVSGSTGDPDIWTDGTLRAVRGRAVLVLGSDVPRTRLRDLAGRADAAITHVGAVRHAWSRRAVLLVPASESRAAGLAGAHATTEVTSLAALATVATGPGGRTPPPGTGDRVIVAPDGFAKLSALGRDVVLTHELTHVATRPVTTGRTPLWLVEGYADYVGYRGRGVPVRVAAQELAADVRRTGLPDALPPDGSFDGTARALPQAYEQAWLACRMIAARYGENRLARLYDAAGRDGLDAALRRVLDTDTPAFTAAWRSYLRRELD